VTKAEARAPAGAAALAPGREVVAVVGAGVKTPAGLTVDELWEALCAARSAARPHHDDRLPPDASLLVARAERFDPADYLSPMERRRLDRSHQLAIGAAQDAIDMCGPLPPGDRCAVVCGVGTGGAGLQEEQYARLFELGYKGIGALAVPMTMPNAAAALLSLRFRFRGPSVTVSSACASGATAVAEGVELLRRGAADLVLAGGTDSLLTYSALAGFLRLDVLSRNAAEPGLASRPFDRDRDGFVMAEGAGFLVLKRAGAAPGSPRVLGFVHGHASTADAYHLVSPSEDGSGALACMRGALADAGVAVERLTHVNAHATSTVTGDLSEARALSALLEGRPCPVTSVKGTTGHMIGASGAVEAIATLRSLQAGQVPPVAGLRHLDPRIALDVVRDRPRAIPPGFALSNSFGFGGTNTALVLRHDGG
jgi:3-oxoacyl-[acyl-carrier-protein] synthase II